MEGASTQPEIECLDALQMKKDPEYVSQVRAPWKDCKTVESRRSHQKLQEQGVTSESILRGLSITFYTDVFMFPKAMTI